ncbi:dTDP-4-dehydrorhamnose reductase [Micromonospora sp. HNM0581]|uniref:dTDP-4-dehydrorhamnose reductase n=1 Tax=Micromonospora sp. HNM0581 TaxID=2716341 RepID=UPI00146A6D6E|nr:dTDP-4-dehydrorhamnose reductase [Micromonospora sp. HNM0581]NLU78329.1 dTDP-4-dehydrorhamnose reductase [Micromonospora sp. HNM0581]
MRFLVTGAGGMLGRDLVDVLAARPEHQVTAATRAKLDITDRAAVYSAVAGHDVVLNTAAWTDVDGAEAHESAATTVNGHAVVHLADACAAHGARLLQLSTDYVFDGTATTPYREDGPTAPLNAYGRGKLLGEQAVTRLLPDTGYVVRTAWLYGAHGRNFVSTMLDLAGRRDTLDVVDDQHGQPTWSYALARHLVALAEAARAGRAAPGIYHGTCAGETTWYGLARAVFTRHGLDPDRIRPTTSARFVRPAPRPTYSVLGHGRWVEAGLPPLADWHATLVDAFTPTDPPSP